MEKFYAERVSSKLIKKERKRERKNELLLLCLLRFRSHFHSYSFNLFIKSLRLFKDRKSRPSSSQKKTIILRNFYQTFTKRKSTDDIIHK